MTQMEMDLLLAKLALIGCILFITYQQVKIIHLEDEKSKTSIFDSKGMFKNK